MKIILRDRNKVQMNELELPDEQILNNQRPKVVLIEDTQGCFMLVHTEGNVCFFDEVDYMKISGVNVQHTPPDETAIKKH